MARYNLIANPAFDNNADGWGTQGCQAAPRRVPNYARPDGVTGCFVDARTAGRNPGIIFTNSYPARPDVVPGRTYTSSLYVYAGSSINIRLDVDFYRGTDYISTVVGPTISARAGTWYRMVETFVVPNNIDYSSVWASFLANASNVYIGVTCAMTEEGSSSPNYRDGNYSGWAWTGTRGNSISADLDPAAVASVASPAQPVTPGATVQLSATGSANPEGGQVTCLWSVTDAGGTGLTNGSLSSRTAAFPTFTAPEGPATVTFGLTVTDITGNTGSTTVAVEIAGPAGPEPGRMLLAT